MVLCQLGHDAQLGHGGTKMKALPSKKVTLESEKEQILLLDQLCTG